MGESCGTRIDQIWGVWDETEALAVLTLTSVRLLASPTCQEQLAALEASKHESGRFCEPK